jgi:hypothetical protein
MNEAIVTTLPVTALPVAARATTKDRTAAERQRRFRAKRRAAKATAPKQSPRSSTGAVLAPVTPPVTALSERNGGAIDVLAYAAAIALAGAAAWFSIWGMVVLFPGAPMSVIAMAVSMESAKLVTAGWLARRWLATAWLWRAVLVALVAGLAVINGVGVFSQLVAAHVGHRGATQSAIEAQNGAIAAKIDVQAHNVSDLDRRLGQIDRTIEEATRRGKTNVALSAIEGQRRARAGLVDERKKEAGALAALQTERAGVVAKGRQIETEAAPIRYAAELVGVGHDDERAIRWLILMMVLCCDPLAIALTAAASAVASPARR